MVNPFEQWFKDLPPITKFYGILCLLIAVSLQLRFISPLDIYYHPSATFFNLELWRILTTFCYFGSFGVDFLFHMFFMMRYFKNLEENTYRARKSDFTFLLLFGIVWLLILGPITGLVFLGSPLTFMLVYLWSQKNPDVLVSFLGLFVFTAPYLPWVLLGFSLLLFNNFPLGDFIGILIGHLFYYLDEIYPSTHNQQRILHTPFILEYDPAREYSMRVRSYNTPSSEYPEDAWANRQNENPELAELKEKIESANDDAENVLFSELDLAKKTIFNRDQHASASALPARKITDLDSEATSENS